MIDLVGKTEDAIKRYIDFVADLTNAPILINGPTATVRIEGARYAGEIGLSGRSIYNSINFTIQKEEIETMRDTGLTAALIQAFNPRSPWPQAMIDILRGGDDREGLLSIASKAGIEKTLILTPVLDIPHIGCSAAGIWRVKEEIGLPTGTAPVGVMGFWRRAGRYDPSIKAVARTGAAIFAQSMGADFIIYGSLAKADIIFPACALIDSMIAYNARSLGIRILSKNHPLYKIFKP
jgi:tetrahydromethanopterin S-methyltransferase subunit H